MAQQSIPFFHVNSGEISQLALARVDVDKLRVAAETQVNFMPRVLGPAMLRPGTQYVTGVYNDLPCRYVPFIFGATDTALLEFTDSNLRVLVNEAPIARVSVGTTLGSWTTSASTGATVSASGSGPVTFQSVNQGVYSTATAATTVALADQVKEHGLRIVVDRGPVIFRVGTSSGTDDIFTSTSLNPGTHSLAFTPNAGTIYIQFESDATALLRVTSVAIEAAGTMMLPTPYVAADLASINSETSADVMFLACAGVAQYRIERHGATSYSICLYQATDGPFPAASGDAATLITPSALTGNVTLTSNKPVFDSGQVGSLIRLFHNGQYTTRNLVAQNTYSDVIRVAGVSKVTAAGTTTTTATTDRDFTVTITGTWSGTLRLQRSLESATAGFTDYQTYTTNQSITTIKDNLDNVVAWYRIGFEGGDYTSGQAVVALGYKGGGASGIGRITDFTDPQTAGVEVLTNFWNTTGASDWRLQEWSVDDGYPSAVALHEGRLWWAGATKIWGSVSDAYTSYDIDVQGDSGVIDRSIGAGPIQTINWLLPLNRLIMGGDTSIISARSNSLDEPLTPTVFTLKDSLTIPSSSLRAVKLDTAGFFVSQTGRKFFNLFFNVQKQDYDGTDLTRLNPDIGIPGFVDIAIQREPDTRIHLVRTDGQVACLLFDTGDEVSAWWRIQMSGTIENVVVLPGTLENRVYFVVKRTINGATKRFLERWARIDECQGDTLSKLADCHSIYQGAATATLTGLDYLEGQAVVVWADGKEVGLDATNPSQTPATYTVTGGSITLPVSVSNAIVGLPYTGQYKSAKLAYAAQQGTALNQVKQVRHIGMQLLNTHAQGIQFGPDFSTLDPLPRVENGATVDPNTIWPLYDEQMIEFPGNWDTDSRICLQVQAPRPCTVLGFTIEIVTEG